MDRVQITNELTGEQFFVMFNPEEYSLNKDNNFASQAIPGLSSPILQFVHGNLRTLDMELFFDTSNERTSASRRIASPTCSRSTRTCTRHHCCRSTGAPCTLPACSRKPARSSSG